MSVEALAIALHHSRAATPIQKLVMIGIANHDGDGGAWPSVATLARYAACSPRAVQTAVRELEQLREVRMVRNAGGNRETAEYLRPNLYEFLLTCPPDCDRSKNHRTKRRPRTVSTPLDELSTPPAGAAPGAGAAGGPPAGAAPEPVHENQPSSTEDQPQTARPRVTRSGWDHSCTDGTMQHEVSRTTGRCAFCGATRIRWEEEA